MPVLTLNFATPLFYAFSDSNKSIHPSNSRTCHFLKWSCCCQQEMRVSKCFGHRTSCLGPEVSQQSCQQYINCDWDFQEDLCSKWQGYSKMWWFKNFFGQEGTRRPQNVDQQTRRSVKLFCFFAVAVLWDFWNKTHIPHFFIPTHHHWVCLTINFEVHVSQLPLAAPGWTVGQQLWHQVCIHRRFCTGHGYKQVMSWNMLNSGLFVSLPITLSHIGLVVCFSEHRLRGLQFTVGSEWRSPNVRLKESMGKFSVEENERQKAQKAAVVKIAAVPPPPERHFALPWGPLMILMFSHGFLSTFIMWTYASYKEFLYQIHLMSRILLLSKLQPQLLSAAILVLKPSVTMYVVWIPISFREFFVKCFMSTDNVSAFVLAVKWKMMRSFPAFIYAHCHQHQSVFGV